MTPRFKTIKGPADHVATLGSLGRLAGAVEKELGAVDERFAVLEGRFTALGARLNVVEHDLAKAEARLDWIATYLRRPWYRRLFPSNT